MIERRCLNCGSKFSTYPSVNSKYCSLECGFTSNKRVTPVKRLPRLIRKCLTCNKTFEDKYISRNSKYCSFECYCKSPVKRTYNHNNPNRFESKVFELLNKESLNEFRFVGDGSLYINSKSPDFVDETNKIVVLAHGVYWHFRRFKHVYDEDLSKMAIEVFDALPFLEFGYRVFIIWEDTMQLKEITIDNCEDLEIKLSAAITYVLLNHPKKKMVYTAKTLYKKLGSLL